MKKSKSAGDFSIDIRMFNEISKTLGVDAAVAYVIMASGTGHDHSTTSWSCNAIENYGGYHHKVAKQLIRNLIEGKFGNQTKAGTKPQYKLATWSDYKAVPDSKEISANNKAWISREFVTGVNDTASPIKRLRYCGDKGLIALAIALYRYRDASAAGHMPPEILAGAPYAAMPIGGNGPYAIWKFTATEGYELHDREPLRLYAGSDGTNRVLFERLQKLMEIGIVYWQPALFDAIEPLSKKIVEFGADMLGTITNRVIDAHPNSAAQHGARNWLIDDEYENYLVPVESYIPQPTIRPLLHLRYLPNTDQTKKWLADRDEQWRKMGHATDSLLKLPPTLSLSKLEAA
jgi:hypothetical protein